MLTIIISITFIIEINYVLRVFICIHTKIRDFNLVWFSSKTPTKILIYPFCQPDYSYNQNTNTMQALTTPNVFPLLSQNEINHILNQTIEFTSAFTYSQEDTSQGNISEVTIEIIDEYVVQREKESKAILSGLKCDYEIHFELVRAQNNHSKKITDLIGIRFIFMLGQRRTVDLFNKDPKKLEDFGGILSRKFIVQQYQQKNCPYKPFKRIHRNNGISVTQSYDLANPNRIVAIKAFSKMNGWDHNPKSKKNAFIKEFKTLQKLNHPNICELYGVFESNNTAYMVMENLDCNLHEWFGRVTYPTLKGIKNILKQILEATNYLHINGFMHRDLKPENIMMRKFSVTNPDIVLIDFGFVQQRDLSQLIFDRCGTPGYIAPEIFKSSIENGQNDHHYNEKCDLFSIGAIFYKLIFKENLFEGEIRENVYKDNAKCEIPVQKFEELSHEAKDLLNKLLQKDPSKRISCEQALNHQFLVNQAIELKSKKADIAVQHRIPVH